MRSQRVDIFGIEVPFPQEFKAGTTGRAGWTEKGQRRLNRARKPKDRTLEVIGTPEGTFTVERRQETVGGQRYVVVNAEAEVANVIGQREAHFEIRILRARARSFAAAQAEIERVKALGPPPEALPVPEHAHN